jgi:hypothetical protein
MTTSFLVRFLGWFVLPSGLAFVTKTSRSPFLKVENAILVPSGDQAG